MTDQPEPPGDLAPDRDLPAAAARRPPPPRADDDEPTVIAGPPRAQDDEPTVIAGPPRARDEVGEKTTVLRPPADQADTGTAGSGPDERTTRLTAPAAQPPAGPAPVGQPAEPPAAPPPGSPAGPSSVRVTEQPAPSDVPESGPDPEAERTAPWRRLSSAGALIWVLLALFGFTLVVQLRSNDGDQGLATARQEDLVRILSDLEARDSRLQTEIGALETSQRQLTSGVAGRQAALAEAEKRTDELGLLAGTLRGRGPGLQIRMDKVKASALLNTVQELRGAGGEVMELAGANGNTVRIVASSYFLDADGGGILVDGSRLTGPYTVRVIGSPQIMQTALQIPGGVVESVKSGGGSVTMEVRSLVEVTTVRKATTLRYARPVS